MALKLISSGDIRRLRKAVGLTQKELAKKAGVSQSLIARIETGTVDPRLSTLKKIVDVIAAVEERMTAQAVMHSPVITINAWDPVRKAVELMKEHNISQMPVLRDSKIVGGIQESTLIEKIAYSKEPAVIFNTPVQNVMEDAFAIVNPSTNVEDVFDLLLRGQPAVLVVEKGRLLGIVTKIDIIESTIRPSKD